MTTSILKRLTIRNRFGTKLEVMKFGIYLFFPIAAMYYCGLPEFFQKHVVEVRRQIFNLDAPTHKPPSAQEDIKDYMEKLRQRAKQSDVEVSGQKS
ncbi:hypothetical protein BKA69DRAFT_864261 [Paraphysoderma sedebokerense]|nr:hypothetical protein BKA69DRAFT_864261 [Paraphysoderma sedebokerense]